MIYNTYSIVDMLSRFDRQKTLSQAVSVLSNGVSHMRYVYEFSLTIH